MIKKLLSVLLFLAFILSLASCELISGFGDSEEPTVDNAVSEPEHVHRFARPTCTLPETCECGETYGEPLGHSMSEPTCTEASYCRRSGCDFKSDEIQSHVISHVYSEGVSSFACEICGETLTLESSWYLDGTHYDGMVGVKNNGKYTTAEGTDLPVITEDGAYQLLNITDYHEQLQLWIPSNKNILNDFTSANGAVGFFAFKINADTGDDSGMKFVDTSSDASRWSEGWCITYSFFSLSNIYVEDGSIKVKVLGFDKELVSIVEVDGDDGFSGWIDVAIGIELDAESDSIILHYYVNGEYCTTMSKPLTTKNNGINSVYVNFYNGKVGMGAYFDDIVFGYTKNAEWIFDG